MQSDEYHLIYIKDDNEEIVDDEDSFDNLPRNSTLKFKKGSPNFNEMSNDQKGVRFRRKLEKLEQRMEIMLTFSGNDLRLLADKTEEYRGNFSSDFLQKVATLANQTLLIRQGNKDVLNITNPYSDSEESRKHDFPDIDRVPIGMIYIVYEN